jgi:hypothetical protein
MTRILDDDCGVAAKSDPSRYDILDIEITLYYDWNKISPHSNQPQ